MVRHTRGQVNINLPPRQANTVRLNLSDAEAEFYKVVSNYVRELLAPSSVKNGVPSLEILEQTTSEQSQDNALQSAPSGTIRQTDRFALLTLQREIGSSPKAAEATLRSLGARVIDAESRQRLLALAERSLKSIHGQKRKHWRNCSKRFCAILWRRSSSSPTFAARWKTCRPPANDGRGFCAISRR
jgi:hypothetical protein